jgi:uncharacterized membrane protein YcaP (DUF421 family)
LAVNYLVVRFLFKHRRLDELVEGSPTVVIKEGKLQQRAMATEMLTQAELAAVVHRQGFRTLKEIEYCAIEPGGAFDIRGKEPRESERNHKELLQKIEALSRQIEALQPSR